MTINSKRCIHNGCKIHPYYGFPAYCAKHRLDGMISVTHKICQSEACKEEAIFGLPDKRAQFCNKHKRENMVNLMRHKLCESDNCNNKSLIIIKDKRYCLLHCPEHYELKLKRKYNICEIKSCDNKYEFTVDDTRVCYAHHPDLEKHEV